MRIPTPLSNASLKAGTAGVLAAVFALGSLAPSMALPGAPMPSEARANDVTNVNFEHHFWRNHPRNSQRLNDRSYRNDADAGLTALAPGAIIADPMAPRRGYYVY